MTPQETTRTVKTRDSATAALRKLGIKARDYEFFIKTGADGFTVALGGARQHLLSLNQPVEPDETPTNGHAIETETVETTETTEAEAAPINADEPVTGEAPTEETPVVDEVAQEEKGRMTMNFMTGQLKVTPPKKVAKPKAAPTAKKTAPEATKTPKKTAAPRQSDHDEGGDKETISSVARDLIVKGQSNAEVFAALVQRFGLDDKKKGYPAWYRWQLRSKGVI